MRLLLDSHVVLWWLTDDSTLSNEVKDLLDHEPEVYVSVATIWELAIKQAIGKLKEPEEVPERVLASGFRNLSITPDHAVAAARLPAIHRDPFDRLLVAQARGEELTLVTRDAAIAQYDVELLKV